MGIKTFYACLIMTCMAAMSANAYVYHEQTTKVTNFDYSTYEFTYEEDGMTKTAKLTDEATTPEHMAALLKAIYTDPTIPGIHYAYDFNGTQSRKIDYNAYARERVNPNKNYVVPWDVEDQSVVTPNPNESGITAINDVLESAQVVDVTYYNLMGIASDKPFSGVNVVVTRYSNGKSTVEKVVK